MAGADVVDRDLDPQSLQRRDHAAGRGQVFERLPLGHFEHDLGQSDRRAFENLAHVRNDLVVLEMPGREIEPDLQKRPLDHRRADLVAHRPHDGARHLENEAAQFRERNEVSRARRWCRRAFASASALRRRARGHS